MLFKIPEQYVINKFFQYTGYPTYKPSIKAYNACCPVCREGKSWGKKKRLFYFPRKEQLFCHNCNQSWYVLKWLKEVCDLSLADIKLEISTGDIAKPEIAVNDVFIPDEVKTISKLPEDCINLFDKSQVQYYKNKKIVRQALGLVKSRRLHLAINRPKALYLSLTDYIHKNRLCIPFYNSNSEIVFYQSRRIIEDGTPKYLSKLHEEKKVFGLNSIDPEFPYIFLLEGPIDAMFLKNGVAVCGMSLTKSQSKQLQQFPMHTLIWCLDNQNVDSTSQEKTRRLIESGSKVFLWPSQIKCKDFNEYCVKHELNQFDVNMILEQISKPSIASLLSGLKL